MLRLILLRGLPGAGKSTFAEYLVDQSNNMTHIEADMFMCDTPYEPETYVFDPKKLAAAHAWCQKETKTFLTAGMDVVVSNTFTRIAELRPYLDIANETNAQVTILTVEGNHGSIHEVPEITMDRMRARWQPYDIHPSR